MKWDPDRAIISLEPEVAPGTSFTRVYLDLRYMEREGIKPTPQQLAKGGGNVWCLGLGYSNMPKAFFYAQTMRGCYLKAKRAAREQTLSTFTPWGVQHFEPKAPKNKSRKPPALGSRATARLP